jgi:SAM-dependent methyltransferase
VHLSKEEIVPYLICHCSTQSSISNSYICNRCGSKIKVEYGIINYEKNIESLIRPESKNFKDWTSWRKQNLVFLSANLLQEGKVSVIELGSGGAQFRELYADHNLDYIGIDYEPYEGLSIQKNLTFGVPIKDESVDIVILNNFIEHFPDTFFILSESLRVLKRGGKVLACVPFLMQAHQVPFDYVRYTSDGLSEVFDRVGFTDIKVQNPMSVFESVFSLIQNTLSHVNQTNLMSRVKVKIIKVICMVIFRKLKFNDTNKFSIGFNVIAKKTVY